MTLAEVFEREERKETSLPDLIEERRVALGLEWSDIAERLAPAWDVAEASVGQIFYHWQKGERDIKAGRLLSLLAEVGLVPELKCQFCKCHLNKCHCTERKLDT
jgi:hypothetical protein